MKDLPNREKSPFQIDPTDMQILMEEIAPYWKARPTMSTSTRCCPPKSAA